MTTSDPPPVICGTDFSDSAKETSTIAAMMAVKLDVPLKLVFARDIMAANIMPDSAFTFDKHYRDRLNLECERLRKLGTDIEGILSQGKSPSEALVEVASKNKAQLLVVSWRGITSRWHIGNVSERVVGLSPVPTLVIQRAESFRSWLEKDLPLKVFVGVDFSLSSDRALRWVKSLQRVAPCDVTAAFIDQPDREEARLGLPGSLTARRNTADVQRILERDLRNKVSDILENDTAHIIVEGDWGSESHELLKLAQENLADLIVVGTHQRHGINKLRRGSISHDILHDASASIACVPASSADANISPKIQRFKRVLAAVDLNERHGFAAAHAYSIVEPGGTVFLLHNITPFRPSLLIGDYLTKDMPQKRMDSYESQLLQLAPEDAVKLRITTTAKTTEEFNTAEAICHTAEQVNADAICIGSHTRSGLSAKILGSVALSVLQKSRRPVLLLRPPE